MIWIALFHTLLIGAIFIYGYKNFEKINKKIDDIKNESFISLSKSESEYKMFKNEILESSLLMVNERCHSFSTAYELLRIDTEKLIEQAKHFCEPDNHVINRIERLLSEQKQSLFEQENNINAFINDAAYLRHISDIFQKEIIYIKKEINKLKKPTKPKQTKKEK